MPDYFNTYIHYKLINTVAVELKNRLVFQAENNTYISTIKERHYGYYVTIGGKTFDGCIEILIKNNDSSIAQIYSEPECGYTRDLTDGETVSMIKGALQLCQALFGVYKFTLNDDSNIECGKKNMTRKPPRKPVKPLSLMFLSLAKYCKTWYEMNFNAYLEDINIRQQYYKGINNINSKINISYEDFANKISIDDEYYNELKSYFEKSKTWLELIRNIPKSKHCILLRWVPSFFVELMKFNPAHHKWTINLGSINDIISRTVYANAPIYKNTDTSVNKNICYRDISEEIDIMPRINMIILTTTNISYGGFVKNRVRKYTIRKKRVENLTYKNKNIAVFSNMSSGQIII
jgi:hypothetical protein